MQYRSVVSDSCLQRQNNGQPAGDNAVQNAQHGLSRLPRRHLDLRFVDAHALSRLHTMLLNLVADPPFC